MIVNVLPEMASAIALPLSTIDKVTIIDGNSANSGVDAMGGHVPTVLAKAIELVKETTGVDLTDVMRAETYDAKENKNVNLVKSEDGGADNFLDLLFQLRAINCPHPLP